MEKENKKKTLTISSDLKKKIDTTSISTAGKKSFSVKKKEPFRGSKNTNRVIQNQNLTKNSDPKKKNFARKECLLLPFKALKKIVSIWFDG